MHVAHTPHHSPADKFWVSRQLCQCQGEDDSQTTKKEEKEEEEDKEDKEEYTKGNKDKNKGEGKLKLYSAQDGESTDIKCFVF